MFKLVSFLCAILLGAFAYSDDDPCKAPPRCNHASGQVNATMVDRTSCQQIEDMGRNEYKQDVPLFQADSASTTDMGTQVTTFLSNSFDSVDADSQCQNPDAPQVAAQPQTSTGARGDWKTFADQSGNAMNYNAEVSGKCEARARRCQCLVKKNKDHLANNQDAQKALEDFKSKQCDTLDYKSSYSQANEHLKNKVLAEKETEDVTSHDPTGGGNGDKSNKPKSHADSSNNDMLSKMLPMLASAMQQQQQPNSDPNSNANNNSPASGNACGPGVVGPGCQHTDPATPSLNKENGGGMVDSPKVGGAFNLPSTRNGPNGPDLPDAVAKNPNAKAGATPVPGGTPFGGGAGGPGASPGGGGGGGGAVTAPTVGHKVELGDATAHSAIAAINQSNSAAPASGGGYSASTGHERESNIDLSQWLPGREKGPPLRSVAGIGGAHNAEIQNKEVNIWSRISEHIRARCSQGLLRDCVP